MDKIINILKDQKAITIDKYIDIALYDKKFGYYIKKNPFGKKGDFITSPLISKLFGEMIGIWCISFWESLGKPKKIILVELGPGDGSLCKDLLDVFKNFKDFYNCVEIKLFEKSEKLKNIQRKQIKNTKTKWIKTLKELNCGPIIFIGNEFFDSLPIKQIQKKNGLFFEKYITLSEDEKNFEFLYKKATKNLIKSIKELNLNSKEKIIEYPVESIKYLKVISKIIRKYGGGILSIDYGYTKKKNIETLQSVKDHKYNNILKNPGSADITHHINYNLFSQILKKNNLDVKKITTQSEFLQKLGILERANVLSKNMTFKEKADMFYRLRKLLNFSEMGQLFKVLFAQKKNKEFFLGF